MNNSQFKSILLSLFLVSLLLLVVTQVATAQAATPAQNREELFKTLISKLEDQLQDAKQVTAKQDQLIALLQTQLADFQKLDKNTAVKVAVLEEQLKVLQETRTQLQTQLTAKDQIIQEQNSRITNRDQAIEMIKELAKAGKRTTWEKLAEAIPSVAAIIALGVAR